MGCVCGRWVARAARLWLSQVDKLPSELSILNVERINRRNILIAVVGAAGLALAVDKFVLSDGLTGPAAASAGVMPTVAPAASTAAAPSAGASFRSPASKLTVYHKNSAENLVSTSASSGDAMAYPAWAVVTTKDGSGTKAAASSDKNVFVLSGVVRDAVRLRREGDTKGLERGRVLRVGETVAWGAETGVSVRLVSISPEKTSAVIEVDGERRELSCFSGDLAQGNKVRVEKAPDKSDDQP